MFNIKSRRALSVTLEPVLNTSKPYLIFQVHEVSDAVKNFLGKKEYHDPKTGFTVALGTAPEIKDSLNRIYLPATDSAKIDITRFPDFGVMQAENRVKLITDTLISLVEAVEDDRATKRFAAKYFDPTELPMDFGRSGRFIIIG